MKDDSKKSVFIRVSPKDHQTLRIIAAKRDVSIQRLMHGEIQRFIATQRKNEGVGDD